MAASQSTTAQGTTTHWKLDPAHTVVEFSAKHMMITTVKGRFTEVEGVITDVADDPTKSSVEATIQAASLTTGVNDRDAHLRSADFLDVEHYPTITFKSTRVEKTGGSSFRVHGNLAIRGQAKPVTLDVTSEGRGKDPWGGERAGFNATTKIDRRDWGLTWNQALETGGILVANDIKISIDVQAVKQD